MGASSLRLFITPSSDLADAKANATATYVRILLPRLPSGGGYIVSLVNTTNPSQQFAKSEAFRIEDGTGASFIPLARFTLPSKEAWEYFVLEQAEWTGIYCYWSFKHAVYTAERIPARRRHGPKGAKGGRAEPLDGDVRAARMTSRRESLGAAAPYCGKRDRSRRL